MHFKISSNARGETVTEKTGSTKMKTLAITDVIDAHV